MEATKATSRRQPSLQCQEGNLASGAEKGEGKGDGKCRTDSDFDLLKDRMCKAQVSTFVDLMVYQKLA